MTVFTFLRPPLRPFLRPPRETSWATLSATTFDHPHLSSSTTTPTTPRENLPSHALIKALSPAREKPASLRTSASRTLSTTKVAVHRS